MLYRTVIQEHFLSAEVKNTNEVQIQIQIIAHSCSHRKFPLILFVNLFFTICEIKELLIILPVSCSSLKHSVGLVHNLMLILTQTPRLRFFNGTNQLLPTILLLDACMIETGP